MKLLIIIVATLSSSGFAKMRVKICNDILSSYFPIRKYWHHGQKPKQSPVKFIFNKYDVVKKFNNSQWHTQKTHGTDLSCLGDKVSIQGLLNSSASKAKPGESFEESYNRVKKEFYKRVTVTVYTDSEINELLAKRDLKLSKHKDAINNILKLIDEVPEQASRLMAGEIVDKLLANEAFKNELVTKLKIAIELSEEEK